MDPEALKDALLEQAKAQRRALMEAALRPGTGRFPRSREFAITLLPLQLEEQEEELLEEAGADQLLQQDMEWQAAGEAGDEQLLEYGEHEEQAWEVEEGVLAEQQARAAVQPAAADAPASTAATPGAALLRQQDGQPQSGGLQQERPDSQRGQAKTPATSLFGRYTPMEGVPERLALLATRGKQPPATVSRSARPARTPAGFTPTEGIPERLLAFQPPLGGPRPLGLPGATLVCSNQAQRSVDSPVEGLVQQGVRRSKDGAAVPQPTDADAGFAGFAQPSPRQQEAEQQLAEEEQQQHEEQGVADDDDNGDFGFADDGGYYDEDGGEWHGPARMAACLLPAPGVAPKCSPCRACSSCAGTWPSAARRCLCLCSSVALGTAGCWHWQLPLFGWPLASAHGGCVCADGCQPGR